MNQFEFMRSITIGQYLPVQSFLHHLDPRTRILVYLLLLLGLTFTLHLPGLLLGLGVVLVGLAVGNIPLRFALRGLVAPLPFLFFLAVLQVFFNSTDPLSPVWLSLGRLALTRADFMAGLMLLLRFMGLVLGLSLASFTLSTSEMIQGLNSLLSPLARLGLPVQDFVMMVQVTLRFLPMLTQTAERIAKAQTSRGADWDSRSGNLLARVRQVIPLIVPLFLSSLRRAENMALAMDARAYGSAPVRTSLVELRFRRKDAGVLLAAVLLAVGIIFL